MIPCTFNLNRELIITDIGVNKSNLIMISKDGIGYEGIHSATSSNSNKAATPGKSAVGSSKATRMDLIRIKRLIY